VGLNDRFPPIVVGMDDSPGALAAATAAVKLGRSRLLPVRLVAVRPETATARDRAAAARDRDGALRRLELTRAALAADLPAGNVGAVLRDGPLDQVLVDESRTATMLVLGAEVGGAPPEDGLDEVTGDVVRRSACPVLVHRAGAVEGSVVVGVDGGPESPCLVSAAVMEACLRGTSLVVLHAWSRPGLPLSEPDPAVESEVRRLLEGAVARVRQGWPDVPVSLVTEHGPAAHRLVRASRDAVLLVVGQHAGALTAGAVAAAAHAPVLVVPLRAGTADGGPSGTGASTSAGSDRA
jgi:nucleotide-binding universal stress UspA family protein